MNLRTTIALIFGLWFVHSNLYAQYSEDTTYLNNMNKVGSELMYNDPDSAAKLFKSGIAITRNILNNPSASISNLVKINACKNSASFLGYLGTCSYFIGDYNNALNYYFKSLEVSKWMKHKLGIARSYNNIGIIYDEMGNYDKACEFYLLCLQLAADLQHKNMAASALGNLGVIYYLQGNYPISLKYHFEALKLSYESHNSKGISSALSNIGIVYHEQNEPEKAVDFNLMAYQVNQHLNNTRGMALNLGNLGIEYGKLKLYNKELSCLHKALKLNTELGQQSEIAFNYISLGDAYRQLKNDQLALDYFLKALELSEELGNKHHLAYCLGQIGSLYLENHNLPLSKNYLEKAQKISVEIGALALMQDNYLALSQLYSKIGQFSEAYKYHLQYTGLKENIFNQDKSKEIGKLEARHEMEIAEMEKARKAEEERVAAINKRNRKNLIQYSGIALVLFILGIIMTLMGAIKVKPAVASGIIFLGLLLLFEFLLVLFDPYIDRISQGEPAYKLMLNAVIAVGIFPLHALSERSLKRRLVKK